MRRSYVAESIDKEYRKEKFYMKRRKRLCKSNCKKCKFLKNCDEVNKEE